jgi:RNA polymerase sigma-70 factor (ECF subfamily)
MVSPGSGELSTAFPLTHWSVVLAAGNTPSPDAREALEQLCRTYWYPLYAFARRQGYGAEEAKDLVQGFFQRLLTHDFLKKASRDRGRFRSFLLTLLKHFLGDERDRQGALKRGGGTVLVALEDEDAEARFQAELALEDTPERFFDHAWAQSVMRSAWRQLKAQHEAEGKADAFSRLKPFLSRVAQDGEYAELGQRLGANAHAIGMAVSRLRQRYRECVRAEITHTVTTPAEVDAEMHYLLEVLGACQ